MKRWSSCSLCSGFYRWRDRRLPVVQASQQPLGEGAHNVAPQHAPATLEDGWNEWTDEPENIGAEVACEMTCRWS